MKVILSRKGFDSSYGGYPSFILPNGEMISLPIPSSEDNILYSELNTKNNNFKVIDIMKNIKSSIKNKDKKILDDNTSCHLDPDLSYNSYKRLDGWKGCFGQIGAAQKVLENNNVKEGDLFLFFGWFNDLELSNNSYKFKKGNDRHVIFGYMQIDKIIYPKKDKLPEWLKYHPHASSIRRLSKDSNCIYIAKDICSFDNNIKGYGIFKYSKELDLTKEGMSRTNWDLPDIFKNVKITYHTKDSWKNNCFKSACRGQEFVIEENKDIEEWAINLIKRNI
ncbi:MAG TPA: hypothetical protein PLC53_03235 [Bacilli bacterium]|nr:hypothetical protein [Bacilli bacterium]